MWVVVSKGRLSDAELEPGIEFLHLIVKPETTILMANS